MKSLPEAWRHVVANPRGLGSMGLGFSLGWIMAKEATIVYWGCMGIMAKKMETTVMGYLGSGQNSRLETLVAAETGLYLE